MKTETEGDGATNKIWKKKTNSTIITFNFTKWLIKNVWKLFFKCTSRNDLISHLFEQEQWPMEFRIVNKQSGDQRSLAAIDRSAARQSDMTWFSCLATQCAHVLKSQLDFFYLFRHRTFHFSGIPWVGGTPYMLKTDLKLGLPLESCISATKCWKVFVVFLKRSATIALHAQRMGSMGSPHDALKIARYRYRSTASGVSRFCTARWPMRSWMRSGTCAVPTYN